MATLDDLDSNLAGMESWLEEKITTIKPLTDDCADIEKENNALEQTWRSYAALATELDRLLHGLTIEPRLEGILRDPLKSLNLSAPKFYSDVSASGVEDVTAAGAALRSALDRAAGGGGVHLAAVNERVENLLSLSNSFCKSLQKAVIQAFADLGADMAAGMFSGVAALSTGESAGSALGALKDQQRKFEAIVLDFAPVVAVLGSLKPETMHELRKAYSDAVALGVFRKPLLKSYFKSVVESNSGGPAEAHSDGFDGLRAYPSVSLKLSRGIVSEGSTGLGSIRRRATNLERVLSDVVPLLGREGFFTATLFGDTTGVDTTGVESFRFEALKKCVSASIIWIDHYISGMLTLDKADGGNGGKLLKLVHSGGSSDEIIFDLVSATKLREVAAGELAEASEDSEVVAGRKITSEILATYAGACERQWEAWVKEQIEWISTHAGVPVGGKRAGVFASFQKFPR